MANANKSENHLVKSQSTEKNERERHSKAIKKRVAKIGTVVKMLESSLEESFQNDRNMLSTICLEGIKHQKLTSQLEEAQKENKQLLNVIQQQYNGNDLSRSASRSQLDLSSSFSTVSMVHLQYKYEELLASHEGLLKVLESRLREMQNTYNENDHLRQEIQHLSLQIHELQRQIKEISEKYKYLRHRKNNKIYKLKAERDTLKLAHDQLIKVLGRQQEDQDKYLTNELKNTMEPNKSLLVKEIRRNNELTYENLKLKQEIQFLMIHLNYSRERSLKVHFDKFQNE